MTILQEPVGFRYFKKYSSSISVFEMMEFTSQVIKENQYVQENYR